MTRAPLFRVSFEPGELVVDSFAGGGGASTGIEMAIGRSPDLAINHDAEAIAVHTANHPNTKHYCESIWEVDPVEACAGRPVGLAWFSPDCTHFSRAKGTTPLKKEIRGLAWVVIRWAKAVRPRVIVLENVEEFTTWGPLTDENRPDKSKTGETFREWLGELTALGYSVEFKTLVAADYGAPTTRKRLFLVARRDGRAPAFPARTHGAGKADAWRPAAEIIDWSLPCPSIFDRARPLAEATQRRISEGIRRFVIEAAEPFIIPVKTWGGGGNDGQAIGRPHALVAAFIAKHYSGVIGHPVDRTLGTVTGVDHHSVASAFLTKFQENSVGTDPRAPMHTAMAGAARFAEVRAFLIKYFKTGIPKQAQLPLDTVTAKARFGLVMIRGDAYEIADIGLRMLQPHELYAAQGFPAGYKIAPTFNGKPLTKTAQIRCAGNSVCPPVAAAVVGANLRAA